MATQPEDKATKDMFNSEEKSLAIEALTTQIATTRRKINTEKNLQIKQIYEKSLSGFTTLLNKIQGI